jgi:hypothetical protein
MQSLDEAADACDLKRDPDNGPQTAPPPPAPPAPQPAVNSIPAHLRQSAIRLQDARHGRYFRDSEFASRIAGNRTKTKGSL